MRHSELNTWNRCRRKAYLQYIMGYYKESGDAAGIGTIVHGMLAEYYKPGYRSPDLADVEPERLEYAVPMISSYVDEVERMGLDVGRETIDVELNLSTADLLDVGELTCTVDWLFRDETTDELVIGDHKTAKQFFETAPADFQLLTYAVILQDNGITVDAGEHNIIKTNKRTSRSKPPFIQRNRIEINEYMLDQHRAALRSMMWDRENALSIAAISGLYVKHPEIWAIGKNDCSWSCDYYDVCGSISTGEEFLPVLQSEYIQREEAPQ